MPYYDYECSVCEHKFEEYQRIRDVKLSKCPKCGGHVDRLIGNVYFGKNSVYRDKSGERIWFPNDERPYFDKALNRVFRTPKEKKEFLDKNDIIMDGTSTKPINKLPPEAGDMRNRDYLKQYSLDK